MSAQRSLMVVVKEMTDSIDHQMISRAHRGANELRNAALLVLRGQGGGRRYKVPGTYRLQMDKVTGKKRHGRYYTASAPGQPPAQRTGGLRLSWQPSSHVVYGSYISRIESERMTDNGKYNLSDLLENGTSKMASRPHHDRILDKAEPKIVKIYSEPYF